VAVIVLDEADEMLDMGFAGDIETILSAAPEQRQTVLFSATLPSRINSIARHHQRDPSGFRYGVRSPRRAKLRWSAKWPTWYPVSHKASALGVYWTWRHPTRRWCSAGPGKKSTR